MCLERYALLYCGVRAVIKAWFYKRDRRKKFSFGTKPNIFIFSAYTDACTCSRFSCVEVGAKRASWWWPFHWPAALADSPLTPFVRRRLCSCYQVPPSFPRFYTKISEHIREYFRSLWSGYHWKDLLLLQNLCIDDANFGQSWWHQKWNKGQRWSRPVASGTGVDGLIKTGVMGSCLIETRAGSV